MLWDPPESEEELRKPYEANIKAWDAGDAYTFTIESTRTGEFIGRISIRRQAEENVWNLGFWTHPRHQGCGYMTETVEAIIAFGFSDLKASRIEACCALWNRASERVLAKNGMSFVRHIPKGFQKKGQWIEENLMAISRDEWIKKASNNGLHRTLGPAGPSADEPRR